MKEVTEAEFKAAIYPLDVHPSSERDVTRWKDRAGRVIGLVSVGYASRATYDRETGAACYPDAKYFINYGG